MKKIIYLVLMCFMTASLFTGCGANTQNKGEPVTVRIAYDKAPSEAGLILADKLGYMEKQGLKAEFVQFNSSAEQIPALASGQVDLARGIVAASLFNAYNEGIGIKLVADGGYNIPGKGYFQIALRKGMGEKIKDYRDLKGMRIGIASKGTINQLIVEKALAKGGLTSNDVTLIVIKSFPDMLTAAANNQVDAIMQLEPMITQGVEQGILEWWKDPSDYAPNQQVSIVMYSPAFAAKKDVANKFMVAYIQAMRAYNEAIVNNGKDKDKIITILTQTTEISDKNVYYKMNPPGMNPNGAILKDCVTNDMKWYVKNGSVKKEVDMDKMIDNSFVEYALKVLGEYKPPK